MEPFRFAPNWVSPPGATIFDIAKERGLSAEYLQENLLISAQELVDLFRGDFIITRYFAMKLACVLGEDSGFWYAREQQYREGLAQGKNKIVRDAVCDEDIS